jgi:hypothetical protein
MSDTKLRKAIIRLAHSNPELRGDLMPLLREKQAAGRFTAEKNWFASIHSLSAEPSPTPSLPGRYHLSGMMNATPADHRGPYGHEYTFDGFLLVENGTVSFWNRKPLFPIDRNAKSPTSLGTLMFRTIIAENGPAIAAWLESQG